MFTVIARAKVKPDRKKDLLKELDFVMGLSRKEKGCIEYVVCETTDDPHFILTVEKWASKEAIANHMNQPYVKTLFSKVPDWVVAPPELVTLEGA